MINIRLLWIWYRPGLRATFLIFLAISLLIQYIVLSAPSASAISIRNTTTSETNQGTSISLTLPSGVIANEIMLAVVAMSNGTTITAPAGWTRISPNGATICNNTTNTTIQAWWKKAGVSEAGPYSFTWTGSTWAAGGIAAYKGVDDTSPIDTATNGNCTTGSSTTPSASGTGVSTSTANAWVIAVWGQRSTTGSSNTITNTSSMTNRLQENSLPTYNCGTFCGTANSDHAAMNESDVLQAGAGAVATKNASSTRTGPWAGYLFALKAESSTLSQSSYRLMQNLDADNPTFLNYDPSGAADDTVRDIAVDSDNGFYYVGGSNTVWTAQKRRIDDSSVVSAWTSGCAISVTGDIQAMAVDTADNAVYIGGDQDVAGDRRWRVEKRSLSTGCLVSGFGNQGGDPCATAGVYCLNPTVGTGNDAVVSMSVDVVNHYLFLGGYSSPAADDTWRISKISTVNGAVDSGFGASGHIVSALSTGIDRVRWLGIDIGGGYIYAGGWDSIPSTPSQNTQWRVEKRKTSNGNLCTAAECGTQFGVNGVYSVNPTTGNDRILAMLVDTAGNAVYAGGFDSTNGNQWRIEKLAADTGARVTGFGNLGGDPCATAGVHCYDAGIGNDRLLDFSVDGTGGFIYTTGQEDIGGTNIRWRTEKRNRSDGALVSTFGSSGIITSDPSDEDDSPARIIVDLPRNIIFTAGGDRSTCTEPCSGQQQEWRIEKYDLNTGTIWLGDEDTVGIASTNITFRLRMLIHVSAQNMYTADHTLKLKTSIKDGTCDTAGLGEAYTDVSSGSGQIRYHDNISVAESTALVTVTGDPTHSADTLSTQSIEELNNFTNSVSDIIDGRDGVWDFVLKDVDAFGAYCFMVTKSDDSAIATPTIVPEITFCRNEPRTENLLRGGTYFCEGTKRSFFWAKE